MNLLPNIIFAIILILGIGFFVKNVKKIIRNIKIGKDIDRKDQPKIRLKNMLRVAFGQSRMVRRPIAGTLHVIVYLGFIIINIEVLEIIIDGLFGTHRILSFLGEMVLMCLFLIMDAADFKLQLLGVNPRVGSYPISHFIMPYLPSNIESLHLIESGAWWAHITGILIFLNYLYYSKHLHILLAFPNTYFANLKPYGQFTNNKAVTKEVQLMLDPNADPYAAPADDAPEPEKFGASDVSDLSWVQLMNAYTCTECGRCTSVCPANITGKELSPRAIMMKTRDRLEDVGRNIDKNGTFIDDGKSLLDTITKEELWACTSCNACVEECPVEIDPLSIIIDMRRYLVMEQSAAPQELNMMMTNIENNGAPWQYNQMDRLNWKDEETN